LYTSSFTGSADHALPEASETANGDQFMAKRWDVLGKFETNFNHWYVDDLLPVPLMRLTPGLDRFKVNL
jgi:hypothetical protein